MMLKFLQQGIQTASSHLHIHVFFIFYFLTIQVRQVYPWNHVGHGETHLGSSVTEPRLLCNSFSLEVHLYVQGRKR